MGIIKLLLLVFIVSCSSVEVTKQAPELPDRFTYKSSLSIIKSTSECANKVISSPQFSDQMLAKKSFDSSEDSGEIVYNKMINHVAVIRSYKPTNPFSKVLATTYKSNRVDLYLNMRKKRSVHEWSGTACHELSHLVGYSHGDNSNVGKENTVPYWVGSLATKIAKKICN